MQSYTKHVSRYALDSSSEKCMTKFDSVDLSVSISTKSASRSATYHRKFWNIIAKFHYTGPTGPDRTGPDPTRQSFLCRKQARTFLRPGSPRNSVGSVQVSDEVRVGPGGSV